MHNTKEGRCYKKDGSHKKADRVPKPNKPASGKDGMNFDQLIHAKPKMLCALHLRRLTMVGSIVTDMKRVIAILTLTTEVFDVGQGYTGPKTGDQGQGVEPWTHKKIVL